MGIHRMEREGRFKAEGEINKGMAKMFVLGVSFCSKSFFSGLEKNNARRPKSSDKLSSKNCPLDGISNPGN